VNDEEAIFNSALDRADGAARSSFLDAVCSDDPALRRRIEQLLSAYGEGQFLESPAAGLAAPSAPLIQERPGTLIGPYKLLEQIGEGGMGLVFMAEQIRPVRRYVALKIIKPGLDTQAVVARFEAERQALALMEHANIARVFDAGATESGRPYFVMELVRGVPINEYCVQRELSLRERLQLFIQVCQAVQHAHQKGIIHRDLKPTNILVAHDDTVPVPKVIDFGVAKATTQPLTERTLFTAFAQIIGTPLYMSPEQAELNYQDVDTRSDVYSLGVVLYELLTGTTPFDIERLRSVNADEMRRIIREEEPPRPSSRATTVAAKTTALAPKRVGQSKPAAVALKGDLDWIVMKALEKDRTRRYESASALAADVQHYLDDEPVTACPPSRKYRFEKFVRRNRALLTTAACACVLVGGALAGGIWVNRFVRAARATEEAATRSANERAQRLQYGNDVQAAWFNAMTGDVRRAQELLDQHAPTPGKPDSVGFEWHYLRGSDSPPLQVWEGHPAGILSADVSPDERWIASSDRSGAVFIWELATGCRVRSLHSGDSEVTTVKFSPDGKWLATAGADRVVRIWKTGAWTEEVQLHKHTETVCGVAWSPDSQRLASGGREGDVHVWDIATQRHLTTLRNNVDVVRCLAWSPDGRHLATANGTAGGVNLWDTTTWQLQATYPGKETGALAIAFANDGPWMAFGGYARILTVVNLDQQLPEVRRETAEQIWSLTFLSNGRVAAGLGEGLVEVVHWDHQRRTLEPRWVARLNGAGTHRAVLSVMDGRRVVVASEEDCSLRVMNGATLLGCELQPLHGTPLGTVAGDLICVDEKDGDIVVRDGINGPVKVNLGGWGWRLCPSVRSAATGLVAIGNDDKIELYDPSDWQLRKSFRPPAMPIQMSFSKNGRFLAGGCAKGKVWLRDLLTDTCRELPQRMGSWHAGVAFSPTEDLLVLGACGEHALKLLKVPTFEEIAGIETESTIKALAFHPDGVRLAVAQDDSVSIRDVHGLRLLQVLQGRRNTVWGVAFSADGRTLAAATTDGVCLWEVATGREFFTIGAVPPEPAWIEFVDATTLVTGNGKEWALYRYGEPLDRQPAAR
jgi:serine/threonine protein kinase/WD40 repeat protein